MDYFVTPDKSKVNHDVDAGLTPEKPCSYEFAMARISHDAPQGLSVIIAMRSKRKSRWREILLVMVLLAVYIGFFIWLCYVGGC